jgi:hypothetical protein
MLILGLEGTVIFISFDFCGAAAGGQLGQLDNAMRRRIGSPLRKSVIFFEIMDYNHRP